MWVFEKQALLGNYKYFSYSMQSWHYSQKFWASEKKTALRLITQSLISVFFSFQAVNLLEKTGTEADNTILDLFSIGFRLSISWKRLAPRLMTPFLISVFYWFQAVISRKDQHRGQKHHPWSVFYWFQAVNPEKTSTEAESTILDLCFLLVSGCHFPRNDRHRGWPHYLW